MSRSLTVVSAVALAGIVAAGLISVRFYARMHGAEEAAAAALLRLVEAQREFRTRTGRTGYATDLASLLMPCPGQVQPIMTLADIPSEYMVVVRAARDAAVTGTDCLGRPIASDYYAAAQPRPGLDLAGARAFASTSRGRIYVFFDGIAPRESDMSAGGLAVPLDTLEAFKIP